LPKDGFFELVECTAVQKGIPRLEFWKCVATALIDKRFRITISADCPVARFRGWLRQFAEAVERGSDPSSSKPILNVISVQKVDFDKWLHETVHAGRRGPARGTTGWQAEDEKLFPCITGRLNSGKARSTYDAALQLVREGKVAGAKIADEKSKAKRLSTRYLKTLRENP
jgi:hypothetical protein